MLRGDVTSGVSRGYIAWWEVVLSNGQWSGPGQRSPAPGRVTSNLFSGRFVGLPSSKKPTATKPLTHPASRNQTYDGLGQLWGADCHLGVRDTEGSDWLGFSGNRPDCVAWQGLIAAPPSFWVTAGRSALCVGGQDGRTADYVGDGIDCCTECVYINWSLSVCLHLKLESKCTRSEGTSSSREMPSVSQLQMLILPTSPCKDEIRGEMGGDIFWLLSLQCLRYKVHEITLSRVY